MKKRIVLLLCLFFSTQIFSQIRIGLLNGPSSIPVAYMMENIYAIDGNEIEYNKYPDAMSVVPKILKNEVDVTFLPPNVAAKVYNSSNKSIICAAITGEGNLSIITKQNSVFNLKDLKGKKVYVAGQGATPEYMFKYLLEKNNMLMDVELDFSIPVAQLAAQLISGKIEYALVPEPFTSIAEIKDNSVYSAIDLQKEYEKVASGNKNYPLTVMVVRRKFFEENLELTAKFIETYKDALEKTFQNPVQAGKNCEKYNLGLSTEIVSKAIPNANFVLKYAVDGKDEINELLRLFLEKNTESIGGKLPDEDFYLQ